MRVFDRIGKVPQTESRCGGGPRRAPGSLPPRGVVGPTDEPAYRYRLTTLALKEGGPMGVADSR